MNIFAQIGREARDDVYAIRLEAFNKAGLTFHYLIKKLKKELNATITKTIKVKGAVTASELPRTYKVLATSGQIVTLKGKDGVEEDYGDGETIIAYEEIDWSTRQKARIDAQELLNLYPPKRHEHGCKGGGPILTKVVDMTDDQLLDIAGGSNR